MKPRIVLCASVLAACADGPAAPGDARGTFRATLSNAMADTVSGPARYFSAIVDAQSSEFRVEFGDTDTAKGFSLTIAGKGFRPPVGTFEILSAAGTPSPAATVFATACGNTTDLCFSVWRPQSSTVSAGRVEITRSAAGTLAGTLDVDLEGDGPFSGAVLHVSAKFSARCQQPATC